MSDRFNRTGSYRAVVLEIGGVKVDDFGPFFALTVKVYERTFMLRCIIATRHLSLCEGITIYYLPALAGEGSRASVIDYERGA